MLADRVDGRIVNIASTAGRQGVAHYSGYSASKFAVIGFTQALAEEVAQHGIRVNAVCPGAIDTSLLKAAIEHAARREGISFGEARERLAISIPQRRIGTPDEVANAVAFLLSDEAAYITGQALNVSGGAAMN